MDRQAIVFYLENVRDMEVVCYEIKRQWESRKDDIYRFINNHPTTVHKRTYYKKSLLSTILKVILGIICFSPALVFIGSYVYIEVLEGTNGWAYVLLIPSIVLGFFGLILGLTTIVEAIHHYRWATNTNKEIDDEYAAAVKRSVRNQSIVKEKEKELRKIDSYYKSQYDEAHKILTDFYNMNIVPIQFRKLSAICYLYDFMNTSGESFRDALFSQQIEDGIRRIESKLNDIIEVVNSILIEQRIIFENNRDRVNSIYEQNNKMIDSLKKIEHNQKNIEDYSRLSANYNEAQAFISMARYLR